MAKENETVAEIIAEMRGDGHTGPADALEWVRIKLEHYADRLEAAHKRELDALDQRRTELDAEVAAKDEVIKRLNDAISEEQRRKTATTEKSSAIGDCAKLRKALTKVKKWMARRIATGGFGFSATFPTMLEDVVLPALAAPARNCDVYNNESCRMAYHLHGDGLMTMQAFADWLFAPATEKEGGAK